MFMYKIVTFLLIFRIVKSDVTNQTICKDAYKDMNNRKIIDIEEYCKNKLCLTKCCGADEILKQAGSCMNIESFRKLRSIVDYTTIEIKTWDGAAVNISPKKFKDFTLVQNERFTNFDSDCFYEYFDREFHIMEDASVKVRSFQTRKNYYDDTLDDVPKFIFCVDYKVKPAKDKTINVTLVLRQSLYNDNQVKSKFTVIATLVSCVFMVLVLFVYCSLRQLHNISGLMLIAYVLSLLVTFVLKIILEVAIDILNRTACIILGPVFYFSVLSSFFWLNVMSFDIWWTLRGHRICRDIHRRGEVVKFLWYCLYAWGTPFLLTTIVTVLDNVDVNLPTPGFSECLRNARVLTLYMYRPMGIILTVNVIFFLMTTYNIWLIKRRVNNSPDSRSSKKDTNRFGMYLKLSVVMGISWCLSLLPDDSVTWYIVIHICNMLVGVVIFFLFVFKKTILIMLCKRFDIQHEYVRNLENHHSRTASGYTATSDTRSTLKKSKSQAQESKC